jgi:hypothetical protein
MYQLDVLHRLHLTPYERFENGQMPQGHPDGDEAGEYRGKLRETPCEL